MVDKLISDLVAGIAATNTLIEILLNGAIVSTKETIGDILDIISGDINVSNTGVSTYNPGSIVNADVNAGAAIVYSKLAFANNIVAGDIAANAIGTSEIADNAVDLAQMAGGTDGNLISYDTAGDPAAVATGTANQVLTSNGAGAAPTFQAASGGGKTFAAIVKTVDEIVSNSATLQDDDELKFTPTINKVYYVMMDIFFNSPATEDWRMAISVPAGATAIFVGGSLFPFHSIFVNAFTADVTFNQTINTAGTNEQISLVFLVTMSSTAGDCNFQWAQKNAAVADTKVLRGSNMRAWEEGTA